LKSQQLTVIIPALRALGNIVTGDDSQTSAVIGCAELLPRVFELTSHSKKNVRKEACWLISNIAAGSKNQISFIIDQAHYMGALKKVLVNDLQEVLTEASWSLGNLASGASPQQIAKMVNEHDYLGCLSLMLNNSSSKVKQIGLEATLNVLNSGDEAQTQGHNIYIKKFIKEGLVDMIQELSSEKGLKSIVSDLKNKLTNKFFFTKPSIMIHETPRFEDPIAPLPPRMPEAEYVRPVQEREFVDPMQEPLEELEFVKPIPIRRNRMTRVTDFAGSFGASLVLGLTAAYLIKKEFKHLLISLGTLFCYLLIFQYMEIVTIKWSNFHPSAFMFKLYSSVSFRSVGFSLGFGAGLILGVINEIHRTV
jgi:uncharacterized membrane protein (Fun14 family)